MGQSLQKLAPGSEVKKAKLGEIAETYYDEVVANVVPENCDPADFYRAICEVVEAINSDYGNTQFKVPTKEALKQAFNKHHKGKGKLEKDEFQEILQDVIMETGFTGLGAKDILLYIFGVPATALLIKQSFMPKAIPNALFIPAVTSASAFVLASINKL